MKIRFMIIYLLYAGVNILGQDKINDAWYLITDYRSGDYMYVSAIGDTMIKPGKYTFIFTPVFENYALVLHPEKGLVAIDRKEKILYNVFVYDNGPDPVSDGLFRIISNNKIGYADAMSGKIVIKPSYSCAYPFTDGKAKVSNSCISKKDGEYTIWESNNWFYIDKAGKQIRGENKLKKTGNTKKEEY